MVLAKSLDHLVMQVSVAAGRHHSWDRNLSTADSPHISTWVGHSVVCCPFRFFLNRGFLLKVKFLWSYSWFVLLPQPSLLQVGGPKRKKTTICSQTLLWLSWGEQVSLENMYMEFMLVLRNNQKNTDLIKGSRAINKFLYLHTFCIHFNNIQEQNGR